MINHARTLLLNKPASFNNGLLRTVYIPEEFSAIQLSQELAAARNAIIPPVGSAQSDIDNVNIVMRMLHSPDLLPYVLNLDNRVTYNNVNADPVALASGQVSLNISKSEDCDVAPQYKFTAHSSMIPSAGRYTWAISSLDARRVTVLNTKGMVDVVVLNPSSSSTASLPVAIIPGYLSVYFDLPSSEFTGTFRVEYTLDMRASYNVAAGMEALQATFINKNMIFDYANEPEIVPVLHDIWLYNPALVTRFGAGVLAYIYALESIRR